MAETSAPKVALALVVSALVTVACRRVRIPALLPLMLVVESPGPRAIGGISDFLAGARRRWRMPPDGAMVGRGGRAPPVKRGGAMAVYPARSFD